MKKAKILYWISTIIIFLFEGVMPALTSQSAAAKEGIKHLGYPTYFGNALVIFKILGAIILVVPQIPKRIKEWAYVGFAFDFIFASISYCCVDGFGVFALFPLIIFAILIISYIYFHKIKSLETLNKLKIKMENS